MRTKILLATVNARKGLYSVTSDEFSAVAPNIQLGLLAEYARSKGLDVVMVESDVEGINHDGLMDIAEKEAPVVIGLVCSGVNPSASTMVMGGIVDFFKAYNERRIGIKTFVWGPHPTVLPERTLRETGTDFIVRGEGYETVVRLARSLAGNKASSLRDILGLSYLVDGEYRSTDDAPLLKNLDELPPVNWDLMNPRRYRAHNWHCLSDIGNRSPYAIVWTSFGCPFKCNYCSINNLFGKRTQRFRSIKKVVEEIDVLVKKHGVRHLKILDELFVANQQRMDEFCDLLEARGYGLNMWAHSRVDTINRHILRRLKKIGMNWISYGFESANERVLKAAEKGSGATDVDSVIRMTREEGLAICADVMFGLWDEDMESLRNTYDFLVRHNFEWVNMYPVFAYPGTKLYETVEEPMDWKGYALYGYECKPMATKYLSSEEVLRYRDQAFTNYHSRPEYLDMIEEKYGRAAREHMVRLTATPLKRRLLSESLVAATPR